MPLAVMLRGRPVRMRVVLRVRTVADLEPSGRTLTAGRVHDDVGAFPVGHHYYVGGAPGRGIGHLLQMRSGPDPHRAPAPAEASHQASIGSPCVATTTWTPPAEAVPAPRSSAWAVAGSAPR